MDTPEIVANFVLDDEGNPQVIESGGQKHYLIDLKIAKAPKDAYAVNYRLHESYYDPERESRDGKEFAQRITSYGDYFVNAEVRTRNHVASTGAALFRALQKGHKGEQSAAILDALKDIKNH